MNSNALIKNALPLSVGAVLIIGTLYYLGRKTISDVGDAAGGLLSGSNAITKGTAYDGKGIVGTLGGATDKVSGGLLSTLGESVASWFAPAETNSGNLFYTILFPDGIKHAIPDTVVNQDGYFTYAGRKWRIGYNQANVKVAVPA